MSKPYTILLLLPLGVALAMSRLSEVIVSTLVWQIVFSGVGEEFVYRGYYQSRLNQAFGPPERLFGIQFGVGLIIASLLLGLNHALHTYDPAIGPSSLAWVRRWGLLRRVYSLECFMRRPAPCPRRGSPTGCWMRSASR